MKAETYQISCSEIDTNDNLSKNPDIITSTFNGSWRGGRVDSELDSWSEGREFESRSLHLLLRSNLGQVVHTHVSLFTKQYKLVPAQAGD